MLTGTSTNDYIVSADLTKRVPFAVVEIIGKLSVLDNSDDRSSQTVTWEGFLQDDSMIYR